MSATQVRIAPSIISVRPNLEVSDVAESCRFFADVLGLAVTQSAGDPLTFAILGDPSQSGLGDVVAVVAMEELAVADVVAMFVEVGDLDIVIKRIDDAVIDLAQPPTTHPWGLRDLVAVHPDGHLIGIGQRLAIEQEQAEPTAP